MATSEQLQYQEGQAFIQRKVVELANTKGLSLRPLIWDGGTMAIVRDEHQLTLSTNNASVEVRIEHQWLINASSSWTLYKHLLEAAIAQLV